MKDDIVNHVAQAMAKADLEQQLGINWTAHWTSYIEQARVALKAYREFKREH